MQACMPDNQHLCIILSGLGAVVEIRLLAFEFYFVHIKPKRIFDKLVLLWF